MEENEIILSSKDDFINIIKLYSDHYSDSCEFIKLSIDQFTEKLKNNDLSVDIMIKLMDSFVFSYNILLKKLLKRYNGKCYTIKMIKEDSNLLLIPKYRLKYNSKYGIGKIVFYNYNLTSKETIVKQFLIGYPFLSSPESNSILKLYCNYILSRFRLLYNYYKEKYDELVSYTANTLAVL